MQLTIVYRKSIIKIGESLKNLEPSKYPKIAAQIRTFLPKIGHPSDYLKGSNLFLKKLFLNLYYIFPIYNSKLYDICSTSNLVHPPYESKKTNKNKK